MPGLTGPAYAYDHYAGTGEPVARGGSVSATVTTGTYWIPTVAATTGSVGAVAYDTSTELFTVTATAGACDQAVLTITP